MKKTAAAGNDTAAVFLNAGIFRAVVRLSRSEKTAKGAGTAAKEKRFTA